MRFRLLLGLAAAAVLIAGVVTTAVHGSSGGAPMTRPAAAATHSTPPIVSGDPDQIGLVQPPAPGLYIYHSTAARPTVSGTAEWAERITAIDPPAGVEQVITTVGVTEALRFTPEAVLQQSYAQTGTSVEGEVRCANDPAVILLRLPFVANAVTDSVAHCTDLLGQHVDVHRHTTVTGPSSQPVDGSPVPVWEVVTVTRVLSPHSATSTTVTEDISARYGLVVRQVTQDGSDPTSIRVDRIVSLQPQ